MNPFLNRLTTKAKKALIAAQDEAAEFGSAHIGSEHLLYGILLQKGSIGGEILHYAGIKTPRIKQALIAATQVAKSRTRGRKKARGSSRKSTTAVSAPAAAQLQFSEHAKLIIEKAFTLAFDRQHSYVGTEHLLHAIMQLPNSSAYRLLTAEPTNSAVINKHLGMVLNSTSKFHDVANMNKQNPPLPPHSSPKKPGKKTSSDAESDQDADELDHNHDHEHDHGGDQMPHMREYKFEDLGTDLSDENLQKKFDDVIGRESEIERIIYILNRRTKNNPLLIGEPGVGKTAIVEGLAKKISRGEVPDALLGKRIFQLDLTSLVAGTMYRGEFEDRLKKVIETVKKDTDIILFIDEIHNIIGTGSVPGSLDAANIIKPALARGEIRCIGATTLKEFKQHIEKDSALERRFQQVLIEEPSPEEAKKVLAGIKENFEKYHRIAITPEAINAAVDLSVRYLPERFLPDKAVDLIDEAASKLRTRVGYNKIKRQIREIQGKIKLLERLKQEAITEERFSHADLFKQRQLFLAERLGGFLEQEKTESDHLIGKITDVEITELISAMTKIPVGQLAKNSAGGGATGSDIQQAISREIIGQTEAVSAIARSIRRQRAGISDPHRPIGSFLFLGPTGVGKTELAKVVARTAFHDEKALVRIDMSEFRERFNISKLIGAPAGYVGYEDGGQLTERIRRKPYAVVLFDEIEKAHPDIWNLLLQILDDGTLTDAAGRKVNFKNTIIIMTSNMGSKEFGNTRGIGFSTGSSTATSESSSPSAADERDIKKRVLAHAKKNFRPEFLNRIDSILVFHPLRRDQAERILDLQLEKLSARLAAQHITLEVNARAKAVLLARGFKRSQGARPLRRVIERELEDLIADQILSPTTATTAKADNTPRHIRATATKDKKIKLTTVA